MTRRVVLQPEAEADIRGARRWYEDQVRGLGAEFLRAVEAGIARIERTPDLYEVADENTRRARLRRFPFAIYYEIEVDRLLVHAVWHHRRDPGGWQRRQR